MLKKLSILIMALFLFLLSACGQQEATFYELSFEQDKILLIDDNEPFSGIYAEYYDSEHKFPKSMITVKDGVMEGEFYHYYPDGKLREKGTNRNGRYYGYHTLYWKNGNIKQKFFINRDKSGYNYEYYENGKLREMLHYNAKAQLDGKSFTFYPNGRVRDEMNYRNGEREGLFITKDKSGFLVKIFEYRDNALQAPARKHDLSDHERFSATNTMYYHF